MTLKVVIAIIACAISAEALAQTPLAQPAKSDEQTTIITCTSKSGENQVCPANTKGGVTIVKRLSAFACEFGQTWGYDDKSVWVSGGCSAEFSVTGPAPVATATTSAPTTFGRYSPADGFKLADTEYGDLNVRAFTYIRYLNQLGVDPTYTDAFRRTSIIQQRQDIQFQKLVLYFHGWLLNEKFRYLTYIWTSNVNFGSSPQVVVAGNLQYKFNDYVTLGAGVQALPGVRSTEGNFPNWLAVDSRHITDEYMRPSYTAGVFATGLITDGLEYRAMLGNNISQLGGDASRLDNNLDTLSVALAWMPTTGEFGRAGEIGDFDQHEDLATRVAAHYTRSNEDRLAQPTTDAFENVQLRISDGNVIFTQGLFATGTQIDEARYQLVAIDGGLKYRGMSADIEYYRRRIDDFVVRGRPLTFGALHDDGLQVQGSVMAVPQQLQVYLGGSKVFGEYGNPRDFRIGVNFYPLKNQILRWNAEYLNLERSPVGAMNLPYSVGMDGPVFHTSLMLWF